MAGARTVSDYRQETTAQLVKLGERQISIFKAIQRIEKNIDKMNSQVEENKTNLTKITTVGTVGILVMPIVVSIIMRML